MTGIETGCNEVIVINNAIVLLGRVLFAVDAILRSEYRVRRRDYWEALGVDHALHTLHFVLKADGKN